MNKRIRAFDGSVRSPQVAALGQTRGIEHDAGNLPGRKTHYL
jgi:hypothetical protein